MAHPALSHPVAWTAHGKGGAAEGKAAATCSGQQAGGRRCGGGSAPMFRMLHDQPEAGKWHQQSCLAKVLQFAPALTARAVLSQSPLTGSRVPLPPTRCCRPRCLARSPAAHSRGRSSLLCTRQSSAQERHRARAEGRRWQQHALVASHTARQQQKCGSHSRSGPRRKPHGPATSKDRTSSLSSSLPSE